MIALKTAGDDVFPGFCATFDNGNDVIERQVFSGTLFPAVLAGMVIAGVDVCPAELYVLIMLSDLYIFEKAEDTRHLDGKTDTADLAIILGQNFDFALVKQAKRSFPGDDAYWLIGRI